MKVNTYTTGDLFGETPQPKKILKGKRIFFLGEFNQPKASLQKMAIESGASDITGLSKATSLIVMGRDPQSSDTEKIDRLNFNGFYFPTISEEEFLNFIEGKITLSIPKVKKNIKITYSFIFESPYSVIQNVSDKDFIHNLGNKELFLYNIPYKHTIWQLIGNLSGIGTDVFDPDTTDYIVLKQSSIDSLKQGIKDDLIKLVTEKYNKSKADIFSYKFILEKDLFNFIIRRAKALNDEVSLELIKKAGIHEL